MGRLPLSASPGLTTAMALHLAELTTSQQRRLLGRVDHFRLEPTTHSGLVKAALRSGCWMPIPG